MLNFQPTKLEVEPKNTGGSTNKNDQKKGDNHQQGAILPTSMEI
jgi:hypothetical protein